MVYHTDTEDALSMSVLYSHGSHSVSSKEVKHYSTPTLPFKGTKWHNQRMYGNPVIIFIGVYSHLLCRETSNKTDNFVVFAMPVGLEQCSVYEFLCKSHGSLKKTIHNREYHALMGARVSVVPQCEANARGQSKGYLQSGFDPAGSSGYD